MPGAPCSSGARLLLDQGDGCLHKALERISAGTADGLAQELLDHWRVQRYWLQPMRIVLVGQVNAGKSTLFNLMIGEEHALTSSEAGTTRDAVLGRGHLGPWPVVWVDTAGERANAPLAVERAGQEQARQAIGGADLILRLVPEGILIPRTALVPQETCRSCSFRVVGTRARPLSAIVLGTRTFSSPSMCWRIQ